MSEISNPGYGAAEHATAFVTDTQPVRAMTPAERKVVLTAGESFVKEVKDKAQGDWMLINGPFSSGEGDRSTDLQVKNSLLSAYGHPRDPSSDPHKPEAKEQSGSGDGRHPYPERINILLNSLGGSLDSAYQTMLSLYSYSKNIHVYVPDRAKSASTLLALGAATVHMSLLGELGPLDTQIHDPRNPQNQLSALDCYKSVDYVRDFGVTTLKTVLPALVQSTERKVSIGDLLNTATSFTLGTIQPMLASVTALDFGGWGRSLRIGEHYARKLLQARDKDAEEAYINATARQLVFDYPHHLFPIDYHEAKRLKLNVEVMESHVYDGAVRVLDACNDMRFVGFLGPDLNPAESEPAKPGESKSGHSHVPHRSSSHGMYPTATAEPDGFSQE